jgi:hypothetical protein
MSLICPNCQGRFLKRLESRLLAPLPGGRLPIRLDKRRCKRCKHKFVFECGFESGGAHWRLTHYERWRMALPVSVYADRILGWHGARPGNSLTTGRHTRRSAQRGSGS